MRKKEVKMQLEVTIPQEQLVEYGKLLSMENQRKSQIESEKTAANSRFKSGIDDCQSQIEKYSRLITTGRELKSVKCEMIFNSPVEGSKETYRLDTMERIRIEQMTDDEMEDLFYNGLGLQQEEDGTFSFVFNDKRGVIVVDRNADDFSSIGWKTICGPMEDKDMVEVLLNDDSNYRVVQSTTNKHSLYSLQEEEKAKEEPAKKTSKAKEPVEFIRCPNVHAKSGLQCVKEAGHDGQHFLDMCKQAHEDGVQICMLAKGHTGDHSFIDPKELK